jgi:hypothetical protein
MGSHKVGARAALIALVVAYSGTAIAQESAYADLDACTKGEQVRLTAKGAAMGLMAGLGGAFFSGNKDKAGKAAVAGAVAGGAAGFLTAYYTAIDNCRKINPNWITESNLVRDPSKSYAQVKKENSYQPHDGIVVKLRNMDMPNSVKAGERVPIDTTYDLMTPDDAETQVTFQRKLFVTVDGKEKEVPFPLNGLANRVVEAGRSKESLALPTPADVTKGTVYRVEISASAAGKPPVMTSRSVTVL